MGLYSTVSVKHGIGGVCNVRDLARGQSSDAAMVVCGAAAHQGTSGIVSFSRLHGAAKAPLAVKVLDPPVRRLEISAFLDEDGAVSDLTFCHHSRLILSQGWSGGLIGPRDRLLHLPSCDGVLV